MEFLTNPKSRQFYGALNTFLDPSSPSRSRTPQAPTLHLPHPTGSPRQPPQLRCRDPHLCPSPQNSFPFLLKAKAGDSIATRSCRGLTPALGSALSLRLRLARVGVRNSSEALPGSLCGGTGSVWRREASAVTNRSDSGCLWHRGGQAQGFPAPCSCLCIPFSGAIAVPRRARGLPGGSWKHPKHLPGDAAAAAAELAAAAAFAALPRTAPGQLFPRETTFLGFEGARASPEAEGRLVLWCPLHEHP